MSQSISSQKRARYSGAAGKKPDHSLICLMMLLFHTTGPSGL